MRVTVSAMPPICRNWQNAYIISPSKGLVHQVRDRYSGAAAYFAWMREAKRENTRCGLRPMSDKAAGRKRAARSVAMKMGWGCVAPGHVSIQICSLVAPCRRPILIATPLYETA